MSSQHSYLDFAVQTAALASEKLYNEFTKKSFTTRGTAKEIKTIYDEIADTIIKREIIQHYPKHSFLTEETGRVDKNSNYLWIVDPLDGTRNFVNGNPFFAVSIALWVKGRPMVGVIDAPMLKERYIAEKGKGSYLIDVRRNRTTKACVSHISNLSQSYIVTCEGGSSDRNLLLELQSVLYREVYDMRKLGSAALECAWVWVGRADAYVSPCLSLWDIAAGVLFIKEAGGKLLDFSLQEYSMNDFLKDGSYDLVAVNASLSLPSFKSP